MSASQPPSLAVCRLSARRRAPCLEAQLCCVWSCWAGSSVTRRSASRCVCVCVCVCVCAHAHVCKGVLTPFVCVQKCEQSLSVRLQHAMQVSWPGPLSRATW